MTTASVGAGAAIWRAFLAANPHPELKDQDNYCRQALKQLQTARKAGHLQGSLDAEALARQAGGFARFGDPVRLGPVRVSIYRSR